MSARKVLKPRWSRGRSVTSAEFWSMGTRRRGGRSSASDMNSDIFSIPGIALSTHMAASPAGSKTSGDLGARPPESSSAISLKSARPIVSRSNCWRRGNPSALFLAGIPDLSIVLRLADQLDLSKEACARRYVELHEQPTALVFSQNSLVRYVERNDEFPFVNCRPKDRLPPSRRQKTTTASPLMSRPTHGTGSLAPGTTAWSSKH
jgi:hypothetical protein